MISEGTKIRLIRAYLGVECRELCKMLGVSSNTLTGWQKGRFEPDKEQRKVLSALCEKHGIACLPSGYPVPLTDLMTLQKAQKRTKQEIKEKAA